MQAVVAARSRTGAVEVRALSLPSGPAIVRASLEASEADGSMEWLARRIGVDRPPVRPLDADPRLEIELIRPMGSRASGELVAKGLGQRIVIRGIAVAVELPHLGRAWESPDGDHLVVEVLTESTKSLELVDLRSTRAALVNAAALEAFSSGDHAKAELLWQEAIEEDGRFGDAIYNLACLHTLAGDLARAARELELALSIDPRRYRRLARTDPDLRALRTDPEVRAKIGLPLLTE
jgi:tetratricopeptide (TPR) repeat protein